MYLFILSLFAISGLILLVITLVKTNNTIKLELHIKQEELFKILLSTGDAVIITNSNGRVTSMNKLAEELTGWPMSESKGKYIENVFKVINEVSLMPVENPLMTTFRNKKDLFLSNHTILIEKNKSQFTIVNSTVLIRNKFSEIIGGALIFRDTNSHIFQHYDDNKN